MKLNVSKIYSWSIVFEPLLFFVFIHQTVLGFSGNISRFLQLIFLIILVINELTKKNPMKFPSLMREKYRGFILYFIISILGFILSIISYALFLEPEIFEKYVIMLDQFKGRMVFEYIIFIYYVIYFIYLPSLIFKTKNDLNYFFKIFFIVFNISLFIGLIDLYFSYTSSGFIGRHLTEHFRGEPIMVGKRYHGFGGEPREAFALLGLGLGLYYLKSLFGGRRQNIYYYLIIIACMLLTFSTSGYIGIILFFCLLLIYSLKINVQNLKYLLLTPLFTIFLYLLIMDVPRLTTHFNSLLSVFEIYISGKIPLSLEGQMSNIYPIFWIIDNMHKYNPIPLIFGGGFGSASHINNILGGWNNIGSNNPHANIIRVITETGLIGLYVYINSFYKPMRRSAKKILSNRECSILIIFLLFILSISLSHRSSAIFIFAGITYSYLNILQNKK